METKFKRKEHHECIDGRKNGSIWGEYHNATWCCFTSMSSCPLAPRAPIYRAMLSHPVLAGKTRYGLCVPRMFNTHKDVIGEVTKSNIFRINVKLLQQLIYIVFYEDICSGTETLVPNNTAANRPEDTRLERRNLILIVFNIFTH